MPRNPPDVVRPKWGQQVTAMHVYGHLACFSLGVLPCFQTANPAA